MGNKKVRHRSAKSVTLKRRANLINETRQMSESMSAEMEAVAAVAVSTGSACEGAGAGAGEQAPGAGEALWHWTPQNLEVFTHEYLKRDVLLKPAAGPQFKRQHVQACNKALQALGAALEPGLAPRAFRVRQLIYTYRSLYRNEVRRRVREVMRREGGAPPPTARLLRHAVLQELPGWMRRAEDQLNMLPQVISEVTASEGPETSEQAAARLRKAAEQRKRNSYFLTRLVRAVRVARGCAERALAARGAEPRHLEAIDSLWKRVRQMALRKLSMLSIMPGNRMRPFEWHAVDIVLLHDESYNVLTDEDFTQPDKVTDLEQLVHFIDTFDVEPDGDRVAWGYARNAFRNSWKKKYVSLVMLQRRWYELKKRTRVAILEANRGNFTVPHDVHILVARKYPLVVTREQTPWSQLVAAGKIHVDQYGMRWDEEIKISEIMHDIEVDDVPRHDNDTRPKEKDDDLILIENEIETIHLEESSDEEPPMVIDETPPDPDERERLRNRGRIICSRLESDLEQQLRDIAQQEQGITQISPEEQTKQRYSSRSYGKSQIKQHGGQSVKPLSVLDAVPAEEANDDGGGPVEQSLSSELRNSSVELLKKLNPNRCEAVLIFDDDDSDSSSGVGGMSPLNNDVNNINNSQEIEISKPIVSENLLNQNVQISQPISSRNMLSQGITLSQPSTSRNIPNIKEEPKFITIEQGNVIEETNVNANNVVKKENIKILERAMKVRDALYKQSLKTNESPVKNLNSKTDISLTVKTDILPKLKANDSEDLMIQKNDTEHIPHILELKSQSPVCNANAASKSTLVIDPLNINCLERFISVSNTKDELIDKYGNESIKKISPTIDLIDPHLDQTDLQYHADPNGLLVELNTSRPKELNKTKVPDISCANEVVASEQSVASEESVASEQSIGSASRGSAAPSSDERSVGEGSDADAETVIDPKLLQSVVIPLVRCDHLLPQPPRTRSHSRRSQGNDHITTIKTKNLHSTNTDALSDTRSEASEPAPEFNGPENNLAEVDSLNNSEATSNLESEASDVNDPKHISVDPGHMSDANSETNDVEPEVNDPTEVNSPEVPSDSESEANQEKSKEVTDGTEDMSTDADSNDFAHVVDNLTTYAQSNSSTEVTTDTDSDDNNLAIDSDTEESWSGGTNSDTSSDTNSDVSDFAQQMSNNKKSKTGKRNHLTREINNKRENRVVERTHSNMKAVFDMDVKLLSDNFTSIPRNMELLHLCRPLSVVIEKLSPAIVSWFEREEEAARRSSSSSRQKPVRLPDIDEVRRVNSGLLTAQVAPIAAKSEEGGEGPELTPETLNQLLDIVSLNKSQEKKTGKYCCAAKRHCVVNEARRRLYQRRELATPEDLPIHQVAHKGECKCCCAQLLAEPAERLAAPADRPAGARRSLLRKLATTLRESCVTAASGESAPNSSRRKRKKNMQKERQATLDDEQEKLTDDLQEWNRQKNLTTKYFHITGKIYKEKDKDKVGSNTINHLFHTEMNQNKNILKLCKNTDAQTNGDKPSRRRFDEALLANVPQRITLGFPLINQTLQKPLAKISCTVTTEPMQQNQPAPLNQTVTLDQHVALNQPMATMNQPVALNQPMTLNQHVALNQPMATMNHPVALNQPMATMNQPVALNQPMATMNQPVALNQPMTLNQHVAFNQPMATMNQPTTSMNQTLVVKNHPTISMNRSLATTNQGVNHPVRIMSKPTTSMNQTVEAGNFKTQSVTVLNQSAASGDQGVDRDQGVRGPFTNYVRKKMVERRPDPNSCQTLIGFRSEIVPKKNCLYVQQLIPCTNQLQIKTVPVAYQITPRQRRNDPKPNFIKILPKLTSPASQISPQRSLLKTNQNDTSKVIHLDLPSKDENISKQNVDITEETNKEILPLTKHNLIKLATGQDSHPKEIDPDSNMDADESISLQKNIKEENTDMKMPIILSVTSQKRRASDVIEESTSVAKKRVRDVIEILNSSGITITPMNRNLGTSEATTRRVSDALAGIKRPSKDMEGPSEVTEEDMDVPSEINVADPSKVTEWSSEIKTVKPCKVRKEEPNDVTLESNKTLQKSASDETTYIGHKDCVTTEFGSKDIVLGPSEVTISAINVTAASSILDPADNNKERRNVAVSNVTKQENSSGEIEEGPIDDTTGSSKSTIAFSSSDYTLNSKDAELIDKESRDVLMPCVVKQEKSIEHIVKGSIEDTIGPSVAKRVPSDNETTDLESKDNTAVPSEATSVCADGQVADIEPKNIVIDTSIVKKEEPSDLIEESSCDVIEENPSADVTHASRDGTVEWSRNNGFINNNITNNTVSTVTNTSNSSSQETMVCSNTPPMLMSVNNVTYNITPGPIEVTTVPPSTSGVMVQNVSELGKSVPLLWQNVPASGQNVQVSVRSLSTSQPNVLKIRQFIPAIKSKLSVAGPNLIANRPKPPESMSMPNLIPIRPKPPNAGPNLKAMKPKPMTMMPKPPVSAPNLPAIRPRLVQAKACLKLSNVSKPVEGAVTRNPVTGLSSHKSSYPKSFLVPYDVTGSSTRDATTGSEQAVTVEGPDDVTAGPSDVRVNERRGVAVGSSEVARSVGRDVIVLEPCDVTGNTPNVSLAPAAASATAAPPVFSKVSDHPPIHVKEFIQNKDPTSLVLFRADLCSDIITLADNHVVVTAEDIPCNNPTYLHIQPNQHPRVVLFYEKIEKRKAQQDAKKSKIQVKDFAKTETENSLNYISVGGEAVRVDAANAASPSQMLLSPPDRLVTDNKLFQKLTNSPLVYAQVQTVVQSLDTVRELALRESPLAILSLVSAEARPLTLNVAMRPVGLRCDFAIPLSDLVDKLNQQRSLALAAEDSDVITIIDDSDDEGS